jgi:minor extracellular serine protease Vpr
MPNAQPAKRGDYVQIYCTVLGQVSNPPADGTPAPSSPLALMLTSPKVSIGGAQATVIFSGLAPGNVGLYQINAEVPAGALTGDVVELTVSVGNAVSSVVTIAVQ